MWAKFDLLVGASRMEERLKALAWGGACLTNRALGLTTVRRADNMFASLNGIQEWELYAVY